MTDLLLALCGLKCAECEAYIAQQKNDDDMRAQVAQKWNSEQYPLTSEDINCDGCKSTEGNIMPWMKDCFMRKCGLERGVETCAHCSEYSCEKLEKT